MIMLLRSLKIEFFLETLVVHGAVVGHHLTVIIQCIKNCYKHKKVQVDVKKLDSLKE